MKKGLGLLAGALLLLSTAACGAAAAPCARDGKVGVVSLARGGSFTIGLRPDKAPRTVANFAAKACDGKYDGLTFHRVESWVVQGGDPLGNGRGGGDMATELDDLPFVAGAVGVARGNDPRVSNDMQFFVLKQDARHLDGAYANFGNVTSGMDVVNAIRIGDVIKTIRVTK